MTDIEKVRKEIATLYCIDREWRCDEDHLSLGRIFANKILNIEIGGEVVEECPNHISTHDVDVGYPFFKPGTKLTIMCPRCNHSGKLTRPRTIRDAIGGKK